MKKIILLLFVCSAFSSFAQTDYSTVKMEKDSDYKTAEKQALEASNKVLSSPLNTNPTAVAFLLKWMEGTPDYTYMIESPLLSKLDSENKGLMGAYFAGMTKFSLENPAKAQDPELIMISGVKATLAYAEKPESKVTMTETLKKLIELDKKGELEKLLKSN